MDLAELLLAPSTPLEFRDRYLGREILHLPPDAAKAEGAAHLLPSLERDAILSATSGALRAWYRRSDAEQGTAKVDRESAKALSRDLGVSIHVESPGELAPLEASVAEALGLRRADVLSSMFLNRAGNGTRVHFDRSDTLTIQLSGEKTWRLRPNVDAPKPTFNWQKPSDTPDDLYLYAHDVRPPSMSGPDVIEARLFPGSVLYVPHGFWHETECATDSVSLHVHLCPPHWADVALALLRTQLVTDPRWRARAYSLGDPARSSEADLGWMREALRDACDGLTACAFLASSSAEEGAPSLPDGAIAFRRRLGAGFRVLGRGPEERHRVLFTLQVEGRESEAEVLVSERQLGAIRRLSGPRGFALNQEAAFAAEAQLTKKETRDLVEVLVEVGFVRAV